MTSLGCTLLQPSIPINKNGVISKSLHTDQSSNFALQQTCQTEAYGRHPSADYRASARGRLTYAVSPGESRRSLLSTGRRISKGLMARFGRLTSRLLA